MRKKAHGPSVGSNAKETGDEEGVPCRRAGITVERGACHCTMGKSTDQRMPLGRFHRPKPIPPGIRCQSFSPLIDEFVIN